MRGTRIWARRGRWLGGGLGLVLIVLQGPATGGTGAGPQERLARLAEELGGKWGARVLIDPAVRPGTTPRLRADAGSLPAALDALTAGVKGTAWRRVHLLPGEARAPQPGPIAAEVRRLERVTLPALGIEDVGQRRWSRFERDRAAGSDLPLRLSPLPAPETPVYLVYSTTAGEGEGPVETQLASLQRQQLETGAGDAVQPLAYARMLQLIQALPPADREAFARRTVAASQQTWSATPGEQRRAMMQGTFGLLQQLGVVEGANGAPPPPPAPSRGPALRPQPRSYLPELRALGTELSRQYGVPVAIDPELFVARPPVRPAAELPVERSVAALAGSLPGIAWRRVYLREADRERIETPRNAAALALDVRRLELYDGPGLAAERVREQRAVVLLRDRPVTPGFDAERAEAGLSKQPVYVLFSTTPSARGETPEARFDDLQRQQIGLMLRMSPAQMGQSMQQLIDGYGSLDPAAQKRVLGLPLMAAMMAGWFPRQAKENP